MKLYGFGTNTCGQFQTSSLFYGRRVTTPMLLASAIDGFAALDAGSMLLRDNKLTVAGNNQYHQLGIEGTKLVRVPTKLKKGEMKNNSIRRIVSGSLHSFFITDDGVVYGIGSNVSGQLGIGHNDEVSEPTMVEDLSGEEIIHIACGGYHTIFLSHSQAFVAGSNSTGQLGISNSEFQEEHSPVPLNSSALGGERIVHAEAGQLHSCFLTETGNVYCCGSNVVGQLGTGSFAMEPIPKLVFTNASSLSCGRWHTIVVRDDKVLAGCGANDHGQLGTGNEKKRSYVSFQQIPFDCLQHGYPKLVVARYATTFVYTDTGKLFASGNNKDCQLSIEKTKPVVSLFTQCNTSNIKGEVADVQCCSSCTFILVKPSTTVIPLFRNCKLPTVGLDVHMLFQ